MPKNLLLSPFLAKGALKLIFSKLKEDPERASGAPTLVVDQPELLNLHVIVCMEIFLQVYQTADPLYSAENNKAALSLSSSSVFLF